MHPIFPIQRMADVPEYPSLEIKPKDRLSFASSKTPLARVREHITWIAIGKGCGGLLSLVYLGILTRALGPKQFGTFSLILSAVLAIKILPSCNVWQIIVKYGHQHIRAADFDALGRLIRLCTLLDLASAFASIAICGLVLIFGRFALALDDSLALTAGVYAVGVLLSLRNVPRGILRLTNSFSLIFVGDGVPSIIKFVGALGALAIGTSITIFLLIWAFSEIAGTIVMWWCAHRVCRLHFGVLSSRHWRQAWAENVGLPSLAMATNIGELAYGVAQQLPILLVGSYAGPTGAGIFRLANQLAAALAQISGFISLAGYTEMANAYATSGIRELKTLFYRLSYISAGIGSTILVAIVVLGNPTILFMSGSAFLGAYPFLLLLGFAAAVQVIGTNCEPMLMAAGRSRTLIALRLASAAGLAGLLFAFLPTMGAIGAAWARVVTECLSLGACGLLSRALLRKSRD